MMWGYDGGSWFWMLTMMFAFWGVAIVGIVLLVRFLATPRYDGYAGLDALRRRFCDAEGVDGYLRDGPVACARFIHGIDDADLDEQRILEQRNVSSMVTAFLHLVQNGSAEAA